MDKNSILGILIIFAIFIGYFWLTKPSEKELAAQKRIRDSIVLIHQKQLKADSLKNSSLAKGQAQTLKSKVQTSTNTNPDSSNLNLTNSQLLAKYACFYKSVAGSAQFYVLENEFLKIKILNKGAKIVSVQLKQYKTYDGKPLILFDESSAGQNLTFFAENRDVATANLFFTPIWQSGVSPLPSQKDSVCIKGKDSISLALRLYPVNKDSLSNKDKYIEYLYTLKGNSYILSYKVNFVGMQDIMSSNTDRLDFTWNCNLRRQEKNIQNERNSSTIYYKFNQEDVDNISERRDGTVSLKTKLKWIAFKGQFFTGVLIANTNFLSADLKTQSDVNSDKYLKTTSADISLPFTPSATYSIPMEFYFGPTKYKILKKFNLDLERQIPLGWSFFLMAWINKFAVLPVFNFLEGFNINYGIIILILTILLKILLFPIAYKTYISSAKMRILKPEIDEISKKYPKQDEALKKQQAVMALYKKAGVSPLSGCVPMLLQFPILIAMFRFFPASIELRQQSFLWAKDLSSYDSILNFNFSIPFYGDHISLFCLLMTVSTIAYTYINNQMMSSSTQQMPGMKVMMYIMPVMFLGIFNNYSSGLSYYYLLANLITFAQIFTIKRFVDEDKLHKQIQENRKKPEKKKSGWQKRLEEMAKQRGYNPNQSKKR